MWTQLLVVVEYYGLVAPGVCLAFREKQFLVVTFQAGVLLLQENQAVWLKSTLGRNRPEDLRPHCDCFAVCLKQLRLHTS